MSPSDDPRDRLVHRLVERVRARVGGIRAAVETLDAYPEMGEDAAARFRAIARGEAEALSGELEAAVADYARLAASRPQATVAAGALAAEVAAAVSRATGRSTAPPADAPPTDALDAEVLADPAAVAAAVAFVAVRVARAVEPEAFALGVVSLGRLVALDLDWEGAPVRQDRIDAWAAQPVDALGEAAAVPLAEWVEAHDGALWAEPRASGGRLRLLLPCRPHMAAG